MPTDLSPNFSSSDKITSARTTDIILKIMEQGEEWSPAALKRHLAKHGVKKSYMAVYLALQRLVKKGLVRKVRRGWYAKILSSPTHGVAKAGVKSGADLEAPAKPQSISEPPRLHDIWLQWEPPLKVPSKELEIRVGGTTIRITFGAKRNRVTVVIANDFPGLDYDGYMLALEVVKQHIERVLGMRPSDSQLQVLNVQVNKDHRFVRLDGVKSLTVGDFNGIMARWYQKYEDVVREEYQPQVSTLNAESLAAAMSSGLSTSQVIQIASLVVQQFSQFRYDLARFMELGKQQIRLQQALLSKLGGVS